MNNQTTIMNKGKITQVIGAVVDISFEKLPAIYNALCLEREVNGKTEKLIFEVEYHIGDNEVRTVAMGSTDGLYRGQEVFDTGAPISVPVGVETLGRMFNVTGDTIDGKPNVETKKRYPI